jgi:hypothetical protein
MAAERWDPTSTLRRPAGVRCGLSCSSTSMILTTSTIVVMHTSRGSPRSSATITGGYLGHIVRSWEAFSTSSVQTKGPGSHSSLKVVLSRDATEIKGDLGACA